MKGKLDWQSKEIVNVFDEASLWSAPFGQLLLDNIPMRAKNHVLDIGFGTGFPLIELSHRFGEDSKIYGIDIWDGGIARAKEKIRVFGLKNIHIFESDACTIPLEDESIDLICSNLGINNFSEKEKVIVEAYRVLKTGGKICITTNPKGTFKELFDIFERVLEQIDLKAHAAFLDYLEHRGTSETINKEFEEAGFKIKKEVPGASKMRFVNARAILDHCLIRIGFLRYWEDLVQKADQAIFFKNVESEIDQVITQNGEFQMSIPMLYMEFEK